MNSSQVLTSLLYYIDSNILMCSASLHNSALKSSHWIISNGPLIIRPISEMMLTADEPKPQQQLSEQRFPCLDSRTERDQIWSISEEEQKRWNKVM